MIVAAYKALGDLMSPAFRKILFRAIGMTLALFVAILVVVEVALLGLTQFAWPWADYVMAIGTGLALFIAFFFLMLPVTAAFAGLYLDEIAARIEATHYPLDRPGVPLPTMTGILTAIQFTMVVLLVNLAVLPVVFLGVGAVAVVLANAYLLSREYFEMVASRHMPLPQARQLRRENAAAVAVSGLVPAVLALVPVVNLLVPLFATAYFVHVFKSVRASWA